MPYKHDVFISIKWSRTYSEWLREHALPLLTEYLEEEVIAECGREFQGVFYYKDDIEPGEKWKTELRKGIKESRCVVALCSPRYFFSDYCLIEWHSFSLRGNQIGENLIVPASIHDGSSVIAE